MAKQLLFTQKNTRKKYFFNGNNMHKEKDKRRNRERVRDKENNQSI